MDRNIIWTETAKLDFENIINYCDTREEMQTKSMMILSAAGKLMKFPHNCILLKELPESELYEVRSSNYRIICQPSENNIYILSIVLNMNIGS